MEILFAFSGSPLIARLRLANSIAVILRLPATPVADSAADTLKFRRMNLRSHLLSVPLSTPVADCAADTLKCRRMNPPYVVFSPICLLLLTTQCLINKLEEIVRSERLMRGRLGFIFLLMIDDVFLMKVI